MTAGQQTESLTVSVTVPAGTDYNVGPYLGNLPQLRNDTVTQIEAEYFDLGGQYDPQTGKGGYLDTTSGNTGGAKFRESEDVDIIQYSTSPYPYAVTMTKNTEWLNYTVNIADTKNYRFEFRIKVTGAKSSFRLEDDGNDLFGNISPNGSPGSWSTVRRETTTPLTFGLHTFKLLFQGDYVGDVDWIRVSPFNVSLPYIDAAPELSNFSSTKIEAEHFDRGGVGVAYHDTTVGSNIPDFRNEEDVDFTNAGAVFAVSTSAGEWLNYSVNVLNPGNYNVEIAVTNAVAGATVMILDSKDGELTGDKSIPTSGTVNVTIELSVLGRQHLKVKFVDGPDGGNASKFDWISISPADRTLIDSKIEPTNQFQGPANGIQVGTQFAINAPGKITHLRYFRHASDTVFDHTLRLYRTKVEQINGKAVSTNSTVPLAEVSSFKTTSGWHDVDVADVIINPGLYTVSVTQFNEQPYPWSKATVFQPTNPGVVTFVLGVQSNSIAVSPTDRFLGDKGVPAYAFTDVKFTPSY